MTEDEAKKKWCPFGRSLDEYTEEVAHNRSSRDEPVTFCLGSACMLWRPYNYSNPTIGRCGAYHD